LKDLTHAIVLTGSIATGKSTLCSLLGIYGFKIIDADTIAHRLLDENTQVVRDMFGDEFVCDNRVDRKRLGKLVFADKEHLNRLEGFLHPLIKEEIVKESLFCQSRSIPYIVDIPLFFEKGNYDMREVVVVYTPRELQLSRLMDRDKLNVSEAQKKIALQMDIDKKRDRATFVIDNSKSLKDLQLEVERFVRYIKERYADLKI
jgi:dephospho-CoA kinase